MKQQLSQAAEAIYKSGLFDADWYVKRYPDVGLLNIDPAEHFIEIGRKLNRLPGENFSAGKPVRTLAPMWPEQEPAMVMRLAALVDVAWYLKTNRDLGQVTRLAAAEHYARHGYGEGRMPNLFLHKSWYAQEQGLKDNENIVAHYLKHGHARGVDPNPFFDGAWYQARFMEGCPSWMTPLEHFMAVGRHLNCWPHPAWFEAEYIRGNLEMEKALHEGGYRSGYEHFCAQGYQELRNWAHRRLPFLLNGKLIDYEESVYLADNPDVARLIAEGRYQDGLLHFFREGMAQCLSGLRVPFAAKRMVKLTGMEKGNAPGSGRSIALFAHYDADGVVDDYVYLYLEALRKCDVDIVFITSGCRPSDRIKLSEICRYILFKNEAGRDFGSWYIALKELRVDFFENYEEVMFVNDSVYFPVNDPAPMFAQMRGSFDMWGITDTHELGQYHLQSWFLVFGKSAQKTVLRNFISTYERNIYLKKWGQIAEYELGLTADARRCNLSLGAWCSIADLREDLLNKSDLLHWRHLANCIDKVNPTHDLWDLIIERYHCPALKLELVRDNPKQAANVDRYSDLLDRRMKPVVTAHAARQKGLSAAPLSRQHAASEPYTELRLIHDLKGVPTAGRHLIILAHYDPQGVLDPHVIYMMEQLRSADCDILFVTGSKDERCWAEARRHATRVLVKTDVARDFGSWALAIEHCRPMFANYATVIWVNDSIYFPLIDPKPIFERMKGFDFWGLVDSHLENHHVMSWFWAFDRSLVSSNFFDRYLRDFSPGYSKWEQIRNFEMRYPGMIRQAGYKTGSWMEADRIIAAVRKDGHSLGRDANVMHNAWKLAIEEFDCPAIKVELLRDNPLGIDIADILAVVKKSTSYDAELISGHMKRIKAGHIFGTAKV